ncbi:G2/M phase checkpoint control protein Sum2 [Aspergillus flavus]|uniref:G2/M phase checkpoint control protein Sum2 n=7 Tax=Aspergillus subgen. Circumdati TaxID=2720871 RepID=A0A7U2N159_ASPFN|nr:uncharacterized protein G4B84_010041 [Aspergillus flavus NRRL3357]EIT77592.1 putative mRNA-associated protein [Aspergillus oryzae 3.042]KAB8242114.1 Scd6-like Sm domain-containing protein [Aspergillus flavus]KAB8266538.1 Scd6-like Sm domain-containing protein [Aspergillus minisclerotigenes]KOC10675.1 G2/M phase checkpoint control protein [Aspergillus flavus AF70]OOO09352.1 FDF domain [Aspergillus oryzae]|eukprot:EIT77592.1 putative mRNA-associated protein [Aspergillus oryzae 3.042]
MDMNHLIGQRFNLISKSDIRYVGTLHEINPEASTIALENVVSFGTEGRRGKPEDELPPAPHIYEYIVFRGSDVKDISVAEDKKEDAPQEPQQVPDDPAILGSMSRPGPAPQGIPPQSQTPQQSQMPRPPPPGYPQPQFQGGFYPPYGQRFGGPGFPPGPGFPNMPYGAPPGWFPPPGQGFPPPGQFPPQMPMGPGGQHQTPPPPRPMPGAGPMNMPKNTSELPSDKPSSKPGSRNGTPAPSNAAQNAPTPPVESKPPVSEALQAATGPTQVTAGTAKAPPTGPRSGRVQPAIPIAAPGKPPVPQVPGPAGVPQGQAQAAITEATRAATAAVAAAMAKLPQPGAQKKPGDVSVEGVTKQMAEMKPYEHRAPRGGHHPRGGRGGGHRGQHQGKKIEVPETDYDFETANAKFNKQDLVKEAIATGSPVHEVEPHIPNGEPETPDSYAAAYNKSSSFFDNISSEAKDREEGSAARAGGREWRGEEEKRNIETFGQGSVDGYRGGYRGRGRGRGYGRGRGGGYGRGYGGRGRGGMRGGRNMSQSTGVPAQN